MKRYLQRVVVVCLIIINLSFVALAAGGKAKIAPENYIPILMYHHFVTEKVEPGNGVIVPIDELEEQIKTLQQEGYTFLFLSEFYKIMQQVPKNTKLHLKKYVVITIDDGYKSNYELVYPILQKYNVKANISVVTSSIGTIPLPGDIARMSWENLNEMQQSGLVEIYNHTNDHTPVGNRSYQEVASSVDKGEKMLNQFLQKRSPVKVLTYPNGNYRKEIASWMQAEKGYQLQLTTNIAVVNGKTSLCEIPRITVDSGWTGQKLLQKIEYTAKKTFQNPFLKLFAAHRLRVTAVIGLMMLSLLFMIPNRTKYK